MRVIAGVAKGHQLKAPRTRATRPTSDLIKGAIFSMLEGLAPATSRVLDLFAGSGALGIEALSRWSDHADFVESSPEACAVIRENLSRTKLAGNAKIYCISVAKALATLKDQYDIILADPPYDVANLSEILEAITGSGLVGPQTTLVVEHSRRVPLAPRYGTMALFRERRHGDTVISLFREEK